MLQDMPNMPGFPPHKSHGFRAAGSQHDAAPTPSLQGCAGAPPGRPANLQHPMHGAARLPAPNGGKPRGNKREKGNRKGGAGGIKNGNKKNKTTERLLHSPRLNYKPVY